MTNLNTTKTINGKGKLALGIAIAGAVIGTTGALSVAEQKRYSNKIHKNERNKKDGIPSYQSFMYQDDYYKNQNSYYDNMYAIQMSQDISSYRYGKHMTGFVNS